MTFVAQQDLTLLPTIFPLSHWLHQPYWPLCCFSNAPGPFLPQDLCTGCSFSSLRVSHPWTFHSKQHISVLRLLFVFCVNSPLKLCNYFATHLVCYLFSLCKCCCISGHWRKSIGISEQMRSCSAQRQYGIVVRSVARVRCSGFESWLSNLLAVWPWARHVFLCASASLAIKLG